MSRIHELGRPHRPEPLWYPDTIRRLEVEPVNMRMMVEFPGQGKQEPGMSNELIANSKEARRILSIAHDVLGNRFIEIFTNPKNVKGDELKTMQHELSLTANAQPATMIDCLMRIAVLKEPRGRRGKPLMPQHPAWHTGNSLGFYPALVTSGAIELEDAIPLAQLRGQLSSHEEESTSTLVAVSKVDEDIRQELMAQFGWVVALDNTDEQKVYGVERATIQDAIRWLTVDKKVNPRSIFPLNIQFAFHTHHMEKVVPLFAEKLPQIDIKQPKHNLIGIADVKVLKNPDEIRAELLKQFTHTVRWREATLFAHANGVGEIVEMSRTSTLSGFNRKNLGGGSVEPIEVPVRRGEPITAGFNYKSPELDQAA